MLSFIVLRAIYNIYLYIKLFYRKVKDLLIAADFKRSKKGSKGSFMRVISKAVFILLLGLFFLPARCGFGSTLFSSKQNAFYYLPVVSSSFYKKEEKVKKIINKEKVKEEQEPDQGKEDDLFDREFRDNSISEAAAAGSIKKGQSYDYKIEQKADKYEKAIFIQTAFKKEKILVFNQKKGIWQEPLSGNREKDGELYPASYILTVEDKQGGRKEYCLDRKEYSILIKNGKNKEKIIYPEDEKAYLEGLICLFREIEKEPCSLKEKSFKNALLTRFITDLKENKLFSASRVLSFLKGEDTPVFFQVKEAIQDKESGFSKGKGDLFSFKVNEKKCFFNYKSRDLIIEQENGEKIVFSQEEKDDYVKELDKLLSLLQNRAMFEEQDHSLRQLKSLIVFLKIKKMESIALAGRDGNKQKTIKNFKAEGTGTTGLLSSEIRDGNLIIVSRSDSGEISQYILNLLNGDLMMLALDKQEVIYIDNLEDYLTAVDAMQSLLCLQADKSDQNRQRADDAVIEDEAYAREGKAVCFFSKFLPLADRREVSVFLPDGKFKPEDGRKDQACFFVRDNIITVKRKDIDTGQETVYKIKAEEGSLPEIQSSDTTSSDYRESITAVYELISLISFSAAPAQSYQFDQALTYLRTVKELIGTEPDRPAFQPDHSGENMIDDDEQDCEQDSLSPSAE